MTVKFIATAIQKNVYIMTTMHNKSDTRSSADAEGPRDAPKTKITLEKACNRVNYLQEHSKVIAIAAIG